MYRCTQLSGLQLVHRGQSTPGEIDLRRQCHRARPGESREPRARQPLSATSASQLETLCERVELEMTSNAHDSDAVRKACLAGYFYNTSKLESTGSYRTIKQAHTVHIHPSSSLFKEAQESPPRWLLYHELVFTSKEYMRSVLIIQGKWLVEIAPHYYKSADIESAGGTKKMPKNRGKQAE